MTTEQERNDRQRCARTACKVDIRDGSYTHRHSRYRYCIACARRINDACPEAPPFDLQGHAC